MMDIILYSRRLLRENKKIIQMETTQRIAYLDILRLLATIGVIFLHVTCEGITENKFSFNWNVDVVFDSLVRWTVPVFVMISGVFFLDPSKDVSINSILKDRVPRLLRTYIFWLLLYPILMLVGGTIMNGGIFTLKKEYLEPHFHLWFLPMLMCVYLLTPFLRKVVEDTKLLKYALIIWICYITVSFVLVKDIPQISPLFAMNIVVGFSGYFILGYALSQKQLCKKQKNVVYLLGLIGCCVTIAGNQLVMRGGGGELFMNYLSPHVILTSTALFVLIKGTAPIYENKISCFLGYVRKDLFGIYLTHAFYIHILNREIIRDLCSHVITLPLLTIVIFVLSLYTTKLLRLVPFMRKVIE